MSEIKDAKTALEVLIQAVQLAQKAGVFNLKEARLVSDAVDFFVVETNTDKKTNETK
jgi:hypothetical protein